MLSTDEDALICDLAETYNIYDYRSLPLRLVATLSCGLSPDSRIKQKLSGVKISTQTALDALKLDALNMLVWFQTEDARKGRNRPESIYEKLTGIKGERKHKNADKVELMTFDSIEDYEKWKRGEL